MKKVQLGKTKETISVVGQGTWGIKTCGSDAHYQKWKDALKIGIDEGMTMIDTAEFYGHGSSERTVGEVIKEYDRDDLFIATKITPIHVFPSLIQRSCDRSLRKLGIDVIDLYQIHFPNPLSSIKNTLHEMERMIDDGKVRHIGVSNFSPKRLQKAMDSMKKYEIVSNQINISVEKPKNMEKHYELSQKLGYTIIAYSPFGHSGLKGLDDSLEQTLVEIGQKHNASKYQIALAWLINNKRVQAIPKSTSPSHIKANAAAADIILSEGEMKQINTKLGINVKVI